MTKKNPYLKKATGVSKAPVAVDKKRHLGRGLDSLMPSKSVVAKPVLPVAPVAAPAVEAAPTELKIVEIERSPYQPRREFREDVLRELAESIRQNGLVQPPVVRKNAAGRWELIAGERRLRAAQLAGLTKVPVTIREVDDLTAATMTATENLNREDLNPIEEAMSYRTLQEKFNLTQQEVAEKVGKGRATVANATRLLELPDEVRSLIQQNMLSVGHAKVLLSVDDEKQQVILARDCANGQLTVRALERKIARRLAPEPAGPKGVPDIPDGYARSLAEKLKRHLGCAVRLTSGMKHANGRHTKGVLEIDFLDNDDLDRIIRMVGLKVD